jgi:chromosome segregation ATPase
MSFNSEIQIELNWKKLANDQLKENDSLANKLDKLMYENECCMLDLYNARYNDNIKSYQLEEILGTNNVLEQKLYTLEQELNKVTNEKKALEQELNKVTNEKKALEQELNKKLLRNSQDFLNFLLISIICTVLYII